MTYNVFGGTLSLTQSILVHKSMSIKFWRTIIQDDQSPLDAEQRQLATLVIDSERAVKSVHWSNVNNSLVYTKTTCMQVVTEMDQLGL